MAVDPTQHRQGIGARLVTAALTKANQLGCRYIVLMTLGEDSEDQSYAATRRFYEVQGFRPLVNDHMTDPETPLIWMIKTLDRTQETA